MARTDDPRICCHWLNDILNWEQVGYWQDNSAPDWLTAEDVANAQRYAAQAQPADVRLDITEVQQQAGRWSAAYTIYDAANPWIKGWSNRVGGCQSERSARAYCEAEHHKFAHLHGGTIDAMLHYARTGRAVMPEWLPDNQLYGYRKEKLVKLYHKASEE